MNEQEIRAKYYVAKVLFESGRVDDALNAVSALLDAKYTFQGAEREFLISMWQYQITPFRDAISQMNDLGKSQEHIRIVTKSLKSRMNEKIDDIIQTLSTHLVPNSSDEETKGVFLKALADFQRYKLESADRDSMNNLVSESRQNYIKAIDILRNLPECPAELLMSCQLNYAILLADHLDQRKKAVDLVTQNMQTLSETIDKLSEERREAASDLMELMQANLERWKTRKE